MKLVKDQDKKMGMVEVENIPKDLSSCWSRYAIYDLLSKTTTKCGEDLLLLNVKKKHRYSHSSENTQHI